MTREHRFAYPLEPKRHTQKIKSCAQVQCPLHTPSPDSEVDRNGSCSTIERHESGAYKRETREEGMKKKKISETKRRRGRKTETEKKGNATEKRQKGLVNQLWKVRC